MIKCVCDYSDLYYPDLISRRLGNFLVDFFWHQYEFKDTSGIDYFLSRYEHMYDDPNELMFHAAATGSVKMLPGYLANGKCDVNTVLDVREHRYFLEYKSEDLANATVLSVASDPAVIQLLLDAKADVNPPGCASVLTGALVNNRLDSVKMLIEAGASLQACFDNLPLIVASVTVYQSKEQMEDKIAILNLLLDAGLKTRSYTGGRSILHEVLLINSAYGGTILSALLNVFLARDPGLLEARDDKGNTPLSFIFAAGNCDRYYVIDKAVALLDAGADPTVCCPNGESVLMKPMKYNADGNSSKLISKVCKCILSRTHSVSHAADPADISPKKRF
jgi:ankyrin repeat protein